LHTAPLLEEERNFCFFALIAYANNPFSFYWTRARTAEPDYAGSIVATNQIEEKIKAGFSSLD